MDNPPNRSWKTSGIDAAAYEALAEGLPASEVWSLLLGVLARRAERRTPADLLRQWETDRVRGPEGSDLFLIDGGAFDWLRKLTSNRRLTFVASGMGAQLLAYLCRADLEERAKRGSREKFEAALAKLPDVEPEDYDKL
jgi:hypothetical protein